MAQDPRAASPAQDGRVRGPRAMPWPRPARGGQFWSGFLFDAAELARGAVVFMGLAGGLVFVLLALIGGS